MRKKINGYDVVHSVKDTGEIICETSGCTSIEDDTLSKEDEKRKEYTDTHVLNFNKSEGFVKMFAETAYVLALHLPPKEYQFAMGLSKFVTYESCSLKNGYGKSSHFMDLREIADVMNVDYTRASRIISSLIKKGVIGQLKIGDRRTEIIKQHYIVNPYIYINGKNPEKEICDYFHNSGWKELLSEINILI